MNGRQFRTFLSIAACVAIYTGATSAGKRLITASDERRAWAQSLNVNDETGADMSDTGEAFFTTLPGNTQLTVAIAPPDSTSCDAFLAFVSQDQKFLQALNAEGFTSVGCVQYTPDGKTTIEARRLAPLKSAPAAPPESPAPRNVPNKHGPTTSRAVAIA